MDLEASLDRMWKRVRVGDARLSAGVDAAITRYKLGQGKIEFMVTHSRTGPETGHTEG